MRRLRSLSEDECYYRCYRGWESTVTVVKMEPRRPRYATSISGEAIRQIFEERIDARLEDELDDAA